MQNYSIFELISKIWLQFLLVLSARIVAGSGETAQCRLARSRAPLSVKLYSSLLFAVQGEDGGGGRLSGVDASA